MKRLFILTLALLGFATACGVEEPEEPEHTMIVKARFDSCSDKVVDFQPSIDC